MGRGAKRPIRIAVIVTVAVSALGFGALALSASPPSRSALIASLEHPAISRASSPVPPGRATALLRRGRYVMTLSLVPNRASARNRLTIVLTQAGRPVGSAHVTASFSMPSMNMWRAFVSSLTQSATGTYASNEPILGMPGRWQLRIQVITGRGAPFAGTVDDPMGQ